MSEKKENTEDKKFIPKNVPAEVSIEIRFDQFIFDNDIPLDTLVEAENRTVKGMRDFVSCFVIDPDSNDYMSQEEGLKAIGPLSITQISDTTEALFELVNEGAQASKK